MISSNWCTASKFERRLPSDAAGGSSTFPSSRLQPVAQQGAEPSKCTGGRPAAILHNGRSIRSGPRDSNTFCESQMSDTKVNNRSRQRVLILTATALLTLYYVSLALSTPLRDGALIAVALAITGICLLVATAAVAPNRRRRALIATGIFRVFARCLVRDVAELSSRRSRF